MALRSPNIAQLSLVNALVYNSKTWNDIERAVLTSGSQVIHTATTGSKFILLGIFGTMTGADGSTLTIQDSDGTALTGAMPFKQQGGMVSLESSSGLVVSPSGKGLQVSASAGSFEGVAIFLEVSA